MLTIFPLKEIDKKGSAINYSTAFCYNCQKVREVKIESWEDKNWKRTKYTCMICNRFLFEDSVPKLKVKKE